MKKIIVYSSIFVMLLIIAGCDSATNADRSSALPYEDSEYQGTLTESEAPAEDMSTFESEAPAEDMSTIESEKPAITESKDVISGIIVLKYNGDGSYANGAFDVYSVDPYTGNSKIVNSFPDLSDTDAYYGTAYSYLSGGESGFGSVDKIVDEDIQHMVLSIQEGGSTYVGWTDSYGNITNVSKIVLGDRGDFYGTVNHLNPRFGHNGYFYFYSSEDENLYRVPIDNLSSDTLEVVDSSDFNGYTIKDDGAIVFYGTTEHLNRIWLDENLYIEGLTIKEVQNSGFDKTIRSLVPNVKDRYNFSQFISPDRKQIAFESSFEKNKDIFIVPIDGGDPSKVNWIKDFPGYYTNGLHKWRIIDWRGDQGNNSNSINTQDAQNSDSYTETPISETDEEVLFKVIVTASDGFVNFREGAGTDFEIIESINNGILLDVVGKNDDEKWLQVQHSGRTGWIATSQVTKIIEE